MTHRQSTKILMDAIAGPGPSPADREAAEDHVAHCSDCWEVFALLHEISTGERPAEEVALRALWGCEDVRDRLCLLSRLSIREIREHYSDLARHLAKCHACVDRLAELMEIERAAARGEFGPPLFTAAKASWREVAGAVGGRVRELAERAVVEVRRGIASFSFVPEGLTLLPAAAPAGAHRGNVSQEGGPGAASAASVSLGDTGWTAELVLLALRTQRIDIEVRLSGGDRGRLAVYLRILKSGREELVASETIRNGEPVVFRDLIPGKYVVEIREKLQGESFRVGFDVQARA